MLSRALIEFAFSLPEAFLYPNGGLKEGLKTALRDLLPESVREHRKQGFSVPDSGWRRALVSQFGSMQEGIAATYLNDGCEC